MYTTLQEEAADVKAKLRAYRPSATVLEAELAPARQGEGSGTLAGPGMAGNKVQPSGHSVYDLLMLSNLLCVFLSGGTIPSDLTCPAQGSNSLVEVMREKRNVHGKAIKVRSPLSFGTWPLFMALACLPGRRVSVGLKHYGKCGYPAGSSAAEDT